MQFFTVVALFSSALAAPADFKAQLASPLCPGGLLYGIPTCCSTNVLNIASLDCSVRTYYSPLRSFLCRGNTDGKNLHSQQIPRCHELFPKRLRLRGQGPHVLLYSCRKYNVIVIHSLHADY